MNKVEIMFDHIKIVIILIMSKIYVIGDKNYIQL